MANQEKKYGKKDGVEGAFLVDVPGVTDGASDVHIKSSALACCSTTFSEQIYSGTTVDSQVTDGGLEDYTFWEFHVVGALAAENINIYISLDGVNFILPGLVDVMTGANIDQTIATIVTDGLYVFGTATDQATRVALGVKAIQVTRVTATTAAPVLVNARAY